jgi:hypothetical protein
MGSTLVRLFSWIYMAGYLAYVAIAGLQTWPKMTWAEWWSELTLQAGWYGAFWPYYFPSLLG